MCVGVAPKYSRHLSHERFGSPQARTALKSVGDRYVGRGSHPRPDPTDTRRPKERTHAWHSRN